MVQLIKLLGNKNIVKILFFFFRNPTREFSQTKLLKSIKISKATAVKWLKTLVDEKIVLIKRIGVTNLYRLNGKNAFARYMKVIFNLDELKELSKLSIEYDLEIYLYGSCARGEDNENSDVDLLIIGNVDKSQLLEYIKNISDKIKREIRAQIFSAQEWALMARKDPAFYERVEKDKVKV